MTSSVMKYKNNPNQKLVKNLIYISFWVKTNMWNSTYDHANNTGFSECERGLQGVFVPVIHSHFQSADEVLKAGELGCYYRKNMPVILLHDCKHEKSLLLQGCAKLEESGLLVLKRHSGEVKNQIFLCNQADYEKS